MFETKEELMTAIVRRMPNSFNIKWVDVNSNPGGVRFSWHNTQYLASTSGSVEEVQPGVLVGSDKAQLIKALISIK